MLDRIMINRLINSLSLYKSDKVFFEKNEKSDRESVFSKLNLSDELKEFYSEYSPSDFSIKWSAENLILFSLNDLVDGQVGYESTKTSEWKKEWIVIGTCASNPIIIDTDEKESPVSIAQHGIGRWDLKKISDSFNDFIYFLIVWIEIALVKHEGELLKEDMSVSDKVIDDLCHSIKNNCANCNIKNILLFVE